MFHDESDHIIGALPLSNALLFGGQDSEFSISDEEYEKLISEIVNYAWNRLLNYLTYRERSVAECRNYLKNLPLNEKYIQALIDKAQKYNYLNESRFAELLVSSLINRKKSLPEIKNALFQKQIENDLTESLIAKLYDRDTKKEILRAMVEKAIKRYPESDSYKDYQKCIAFLMRKGFHYSDFSDLLRAYYRETGE